MFCDLFLVPLLITGHIIVFLVFKRRRFIQSEICIVYFQSTTVKQFLLIHFPTSLMLNQNMRLIPWVMTTGNVTSVLTTADVTSMASNRNGGNCRNSKNCGKSRNKGNGGSIRNVRNSRNSRNKGNGGTSRNGRNGRSSRNRRNLL